MRGDPRARLRAQAVLGAQPPRPLQRRRGRRERGVAPQLGGQHEPRRAFEQRGRGLQVAARASPEPREGVDGLDHGHHARAGRDAREVGDARRAARSRRGRRPARASTYAASAATSLNGSGDSASSRRTVRSAASGRPPWTSASARHAEDVRGGDGAPERVEVELGEQRVGAAR